MSESNQCGRSMVEMLGVLAIIGVLSVGGIAGYSLAMSKYKITKALDQVQTIVTNMRTFYSSQRQITPMTAQDAFNIGTLNEESYDVSAKKGLNPFGGEINFGGGSERNAGRTFTIEYTGLTPEACLKMATADWGADASSGLVSITVGSGVSGIRYTWGSGEHPLPVDLVDGAESCTLTPSVIWEFR